MKRLLTVLGLVSLLLVSCAKDDKILEDDSYANVGSLERLEYYPITTEGCGLSKLEEDPAEMLMSGGPLTFVTAGAIGIFILENVGKTILSTVGSKAFDSIKEYFFGPDEATKAMNEMSELAAQMEEKMKSLLHNAERTLEITEDISYNVIRSAYLAFHAKMNNLTSLNNLYCNSLFEDPGKLDEEKMKELINEWGKTLVNGNLAKDNVKYLYEDLKSFYYTYQKRNRNLLSVFDMFVFCTRPWEKYGYDVRESFRATLAAEFARTIYLTSLYYKINSPSKEKVQNDLSEIAINLKNFLSMEGNQVVRSEDAVCQISGAQITIKNYASTDGNWCILQSNAYPFPGGQLTKSELDAIATFYKNQGVDDEFTLIDCLNDGGLEISKEPVGGHNPKIVLQGTSFTYRYLGGKMYTDCTLAFSGYADNVPVNSYKGSYCSVTYDNVPVYDYVIFDMTGNFLVAPDGIIRDKDSN